MSPPVLGTILTLCIGYILPMANGRVPLYECIAPSLTLTPDSPDTARDSETSSPPSSLAPTHEATATDTAVSLLRASGIRSAFLVLPGKGNGECGTCRKKFPVGSVAFEWQVGLTETVWYFHEACLQPHSAIQGADSDTYDRLCIMMEAVTNETIKECLRRLLAEFGNLLDPDEDSQIALGSRIYFSNKFRRMCNHI